MTALLAFLGPDGILWALGAAVLAVFGFYMKDVGRKGAEAKQARAETKARDISDEIDDAVAGRAPDENRRRLEGWSKS